MAAHADIFANISAARRKHADRRRKQAQIDFPVARDLAESLGMMLTQHNDRHFQIYADGWFACLYPGNQRIESRRGRDPGPYLNVEVDQDSGEWRLLDVVRAAGRIQR